MDKILRNEQLFEAANLKMAQAMSRLAPATQPEDFTLALYCECANTACEDRMHIVYKTYSAIKKSGEATFVVKPEHYLPQFEALITKTEEYWVIQKKLEKLGQKFEL
jgi:hypothetical protein